MRGGALSFLDIQQNQGEEAAIAAARRALSDDPFGTKQRGGSMTENLANQMRQEAMLSSTGGLENYQAGAREYLASQSSYQPGRGVDITALAARARASLAAGDVDATSWGTGGAGTVAPTAGGVLAGSNQSITALAMAIGVEVAKAMRASPPVITVGAEMAQKGIANSKNHRRGQF